MATQPLFNISDPSVSKRLLRKAMLAAADRAVAILRKTAPVSTGRSGPLRRGELPGNPANGQHLRDTFSYRVRGDVIEIVSDAPHFLPVTEGSKPHRIAGNPFLAFPNKGFLTGTPQGQRILSANRSRARRLGTAGPNGLFGMVVPVVHHRGNKANRFFAKVARMVPSMIAEELQRLT